MARRALLQCCQAAWRGSGTNLVADLVQAPPASSVLLLERFCRPLTSPWQQEACYSSHAGDNSSSSSSGSSSSSSSNPAAEAVVDNLSSMMEVMMQNPQMQAMLLSRMPPHMRRPEVLRAMMANPEVRQRIAALAQQTGLDKMVGQLDASRMAAGISATSAAGLDPAAVMQRLSESPLLGPRMGDPRVMAALMEMATNGPQALKKYEGDKDVLDAAMEAGAIIQQMQQEHTQAGADGSSSSSSSSSSGANADASAAAAVEQQLGMQPDELMARLMQRPDLLARVQDPAVQAALLEVSQSPWKIVKYVFNKEVMAAIKELKDVMVSRPPPSS